MSGEIKKRLSIENKLSSVSSHDPKSRINNIIEAIKNIKFPGRNGAERKKAEEIARKMGLFERLGVSEKSLLPEKSESKK